MHLTRRITILLLAAASVMWMLVLPLNLSAADAATGAPEIDYARFAYVYHIESGTEMFVKNGDTKCYPAASVKLMTGLIAAEHLYTQQSRKVIVTAEELQGVRGNNIGLKVGEELTVGDLLAALITGNANDAAQVLAYEIAGGIEPFVKMMNARAAELGMNSTVIRMSPDFTTLRWSPRCGIPQRWRLPATATTPFWSYPVRSGMCLLPPTLTVRNGA